MSGGGGGKYDDGRRRGVNGRKREVSRSEGAYAICPS